MPRLDWQLLRPAKADDDDVTELVRETDALVSLATERVLDAGSIDHLVALERRHEARTVAPCDAVDAPRVEDDPDWEGRAIDEFADSDIDMELEDFLALRRREPDCERCPFAQPYSVYPMDPCEFSAGALYDVIDDAEVHAAMAKAMGPAQMTALADTLDAALSEGRVRDSHIVDADDYIRKARYFLRFWAQHGFGVRPISIDDMDPVLTPEGPIGASSDDDAPSSLLH